jgi:hypothetical protein
VADPIPAAPSVAGDALKPVVQGADTAAIQQPVISQEDLVSLLAAAAPLRHETPDAAAERFHRVGVFQRKLTLGDYLALESQRSEYAVTIHYTKSAAGWEFTNVQADLFASPGRDLEAVYQAADKTLRTRLKKPVWTRPSERAPFKTKGYRVGKILELTIAIGDDETHDACISLELGEVQGEEE